MSGHKKIVTVAVIILAVVLNCLIFINYKVSPGQRTVDVHVTLISNQAQDMQMFYLESEDGADTIFNETDMAAAAYEEAEAKETLTFTVPADVCQIRFDLGEQSSVTEISEITVEYENQELFLTEETLANPLETSDLKSVFFEKVLQIESQDGDPYLVWDVSDCGIAEMVQEQNYLQDTLKKVFLCAGIDLVLCILAVFYDTILSIPKALWENKKLVLRLSRNDFKTKFAGSYLGVFWAFVQPIVTVLLYWFVFEKGLKAGSVNTRAGITVPFVLWLIAGLVPWFFFSDSLSGGTNALMEYQYLVKKVVFKIEILPALKVIASLFVHVFFIAFMFILYLLMGYGFHLSYIQVIYYSFCVFVLAMGLCYATSAIAVFFRDLTQVVNIVLQVGVWLTPIMWNFDSIELPSVLRIIFMMNPMYYVVQGYRAAMIDYEWFWQTPILTGYFWGFVVVCFALGTAIFRRLKVHFADVL